MYKFSFFTILSGFFLLAACNNDNSEGVQAIKGGPNSDVIRNPITADEPLDTNKLARIVFEQPLYNFGKTKEGNHVEHSYTFTNTGKVPLVISNCKATCGCTVPEWPKDEVPPGGTGVIKATFNTESRDGHQRKGITITANTYPNETLIYLEGDVIKK